MEDWGSLGAPERHENGYSHLSEMGVSIFETFLSSRKQQPELRLLCAEELGRLAGPPFEKTEGLPAASGGLAHA